MALVAQMTDQQARVEVVQGDAVLLQNKVDEQAITIKAQQEIIASQQKATEELKGKVGSLQQQIDTQNGILHPLHQQVQQHNKQLRCF